MKNLAIISLAILTMCFTCEETQIEEQVEYLSYGTSFGECLGYCKKEVRVGGNIVYTKSGWDLDGLLPDSTCTLTFIRDPLPDYVDEINLKDFKNLDEVIGCPDCADGGAEWLELSINGKVKRVTFEYMHEPNEIKPVIEDLRLLLEGFEGCGR